ncbi:MAG: hypothetical protein KJ977_04915, partial [Candidatus Omnitrophica bacterium]|nr:hypothetical protein [Candidatus Omnitrophota bacterium]
MNSSTEVLLAWAIFLGFIKRVVTGLAERDKEGGIDFGNASSSLRARGIRNSFNSLDKFEAFITGEGKFKDVFLVNAIKGMRARNRIDDFLALAAEENVYAAFDVAHADRVTIEAFLENRDAVITIRDNGLPVRFDLRGPLERYRHDLVLTFERNGLDVMKMFVQYGGAVRWYSQNSGTVTELRVPRSLIGEAFDVAGTEFIDFDDSHRLTEDSYKWTPVRKGSSSNTSGLQGFSIEQINSRRLAEAISVYPNGNREIIKIAREVGFTQVNLSENVEYIDKQIHTRGKLYLRGMVLVKQSGWYLYYSSGLRGGFYEVLVISADNQRHYFLITSKAKLAGIDISDKYRQDSQWTESLLYTNPGQVQAKIQIEGRIVASSTLTLTAKTQANPRHPERNDDRFISRVLRRDELVLAGVVDGFDNTGRWGATAAKVVSGELERFISHKIKTKANAELSKQWLIREVLVPAAYSAQKRLVKTMNIYKRRGWLASEKSQDARDVGAAFTVALLWRQPKTDSLHFLGLQAGDTQALLYSPSTEELSNLTISNVYNYYGQQDIKRYRNYTWQAITSLTEPFGLRSVRNIAQVASRKRTMQELWKVKTYEAVARRRGNDAFSRMFKTRNIVTNAITCHVSSETVGAAHPYFPIVFTHSLDSRQPHRFYFLTDGLTDSFSWEDLLVVVQTAKPAAGQIKDLFDSLNIRKTEITASIREAFITVIDYLRNISQKLTSVSTTAVFLEKLNLLVAEAEKELAGYYSGQLSYPDSYDIAAYAAGMKTVFKGLEKHLFPAEKTGPDYGKVQQAFRTLDAFIESSHFRYKPDDSTAVIVQIIPQQVAGVSSSPNISLSKKAMSLHNASVRSKFPPKYRGSNGGRMKHLSASKNLRRKSVGSSPVNEKGLRERLTVLERLKVNDQQSVKAWAKEHGLFFGPPLIGDFYLKGFYDKKAWKNPDRVLTSWQFDRNIPLRRSRFNDQQFNQQWTAGNVEDLIRAYANRRLTAQPLFWSSLFSEINAWFNHIKRITRRSQPRGNRFKCLTGKLKSYQEIPKAIKDKWGQVSPLEWMLQEYIQELAGQEKAEKLFGEVDISGLNLADLAIWPLEDDYQKFSQLTEWMIHLYRAPPLGYYEIEKNSLRQLWPETNPQPKPRPTRQLTLFDTKSFKASSSSAGRTIAVVAVHEKNNRIVSDILSAEGLTHRFLPINLFQYNSAISAEVKKFISGLNNPHLSVVIHGESWGRCVHCALKGAALGIVEVISRNMKSPRKAEILIAFDKIRGIKERIIENPNAVWRNLQRLHILVDNLWLIPHRIFIYGRQYPDFSNKKFKASEVDFTIRIFRTSDEMARYLSSSRQSSSTQARKILPEEVLPRPAQQLQKRLKSLLDKIDWLKEEGITAADLDKPEASFVLHLGKDVTNSSLPKALYFAFNRTKLGKYVLEELRAGLKVYVFPIELAESPDIDTSLINVLEQIKLHPKVIAITVTKPVKDMILQEKFRKHLCDSWTVKPTGLGSVNQVFLRHFRGTLSAEAHNKDGQAFVKAYKNHWNESIQPNTFKNKKVVVLGFGGTGQAVVDALLSEGRDRPLIIIISHWQRSFPKALKTFLVLRQRFRKRGLPKQFRLKLIPAEDPENLAEDNPVLLRHLREADIIINATPQGMNGRDEAAISRKALTSVFRNLKHKPIVIDVIHRREDGAPLATYFLREAYRQGITTVYNGLDMWYENIFLLAFSCLENFAQTSIRSAKIREGEKVKFLDEVYSLSKSFRASNLQQAVDIIKQEERGLDPAIEEMTFTRSSRGTPLKDQWGSHRQGLKRKFLPVYQKKVKAKERRRQIAKQKKKEQNLQRRLAVESKQRWKDVRRRFGDKRGPHSSSSSSSVHIQISSLDIYPQYNILREKLKAVLGGRDFARVTGRLEEFMLHQTPFAFRSAKALIHLIELIFSPYVDRRIGDALIEFESTYGFIGDNLNISRLSQGGNLMSFYFAHQLFKRGYSLEALSIKVKKDQKAAQPDAVV